MTPELLTLLTPDQREAWERCQKATAGPWHDAGNFVRDKYDHDLMAAYQRMCWKRDGEVWTEEESAQGYKNRSVLDVRNNAAFAAHARQDLPAALLELAQAKQALAEAKSRLLHTQAGLTVWMERSKANARELDEAYDAMCEIAQMLDCAEDWAAIKAALKETLRAQRADAAEKALADCTRSHQRTNAKLAEVEKDAELLDWLIDRLNSAEDTEDLWDLCPGTSDDVHEEFRAAIRAARGKKRPRFCEISRFWWMLPSA